MHRFILNVKNVFEYECHVLFHKFQNLKAYSYMHLVMNCISVDHERWVSWIIYFIYVLNLYYFCAHSRRIILIGYNAFLGMILFPKVYSSLQGTWIKFCLSRWIKFCVYPSKTFPVGAYSAESGPSSSQPRNFAFPKKTYAAMKYQNLEGDKIGHFGKCRKVWILKISWS